MFYTHSDMESNGWTDRKSIFISKLFSGSSHSVEGQTIIKSVEKLIECNERVHVSLVGKQTADMLDGTRVQTKAPVRWEQVQDRWLVKHCQHT